VAGAGERAVLETFLDLYRDAIIRKVGGVSDDDARRRLVGSATTLGGTSRPISGWTRSPCGGSTST
jgi:hypothetical protein